MKNVIIVLLLIVLSCPVATAQEIPQNAEGVIWIPCLDVRMPVYTAQTTDKQTIIDNEKSALLENWGAAYNICDHAFSTDENGKEWNIQKVFCGAYAWFYTNDATYYLECYMTGKTEYDGNEYINGRLVTPCSSHDIMLSCCAEDSDHHFIAVFRRLNEF